MNAITKRPESLLDVTMHYCPGCGHSVAHRLIAETMDELKIRERTVVVAPVGCAVFADKYFNCDSIQGPHGRGPAIATGIKRAKPDSIVFSYQGDGDLASIGMAEIVHAAARGENITVIFINNAIYGMTGGQMAPTTLVGQTATTAPKGRNPLLQGFPMNISEMLSKLESPRYIERVSVDSAPNVIKAKKAIKKAFENQVNKIGFSFVEVLSICPTNWGVTPLKGLDFLREKMMPQYPLGVFKDEKESVAQKIQEGK
ncbi:MAG: 2-oxoglutarate oxidoreductase [Elusimicrobiota bacterium]|jgi:2-oxoglutarate ferredoxin oxidoreductase subunit beta|nr:2-oxoglutarate oxidoreductase [Elusimicrobiota bacterium]